MENKMSTDKKWWNQPRLTVYGDVEQVTGQTVCKDKFVGTQDDFGIIGVEGSRVVAVGPNC